MILRTPLQRKRRAESPAVDHEGPTSDRRLVIYNDPPPVAVLEASSDDLVCTHQCRQMVKSEFMVAFNTAEKQVVEYQSKIESLDNELLKSEEERINYRDQLRSVERELEASKGRENALQERLLKEVGESQERYQSQLKRCYELEAQVKKEFDLHKKAELLAEEGKEKITVLEGELQRLSGRSEREKKHLQKELLHLQEESKLSICRITADLDSQKLRADNYEKETELLKDQLKDLQEQLNECLRQKSELEHKLSTFTAPSNETGLSDSQTLVKHLQEELRNYEAEVHEARRLKSSHLSCDLLKEKLREEKSHREKAEMELSKLQEIHVNAQKLEGELASWKSLIREIPDVSCCDDIPQKFGALQREAIEGMLKIGEINMHLKELEVALDLSELGRQEAEKEAALAKEKAENSLLEVKRVEQMLSSVMKDKEQLSKDQATYNKQKNGLFDSGVESKTAVEDLEKALAQRDADTRELEARLHEQREIIDRQHNELKLMNERLGVEARRAKSLEREGDRLRSEISLLESKLGHGDFSTENTKVMRMVNTLAVDNEAKHAIEALRAELQKTQAKLQAVEELKGQTDAGKIIDADIPEKLAQLKRQIAVLEKREERYKTVFAERISVFRRACCSLFGYKIVMDDQQRPNGIPVTRFTLQSIYAQSDDEKLEFDYESGTMTILVNDYTSQPEISHQVEIFIRKMNSIPAFTANLTMESFNKRTLS